MAEPTMVSELEPYLKAGWELVPLHWWNEVTKKGAGTKRVATDDPAVLEAEKKAGWREVGKAPKDAGWRRKQYGRDAIRAHMSAGLNVGVRLRPGDLVLDVDRRNFPPGRDCLKELVAATGLNLDRYPRVATGTNGDHFYMRKDPAADVKATLPDFPGIEFKTVGVQVVAAGSVHPNGRRYRWDDLSPGIEEAPLAPERLMGLIRRPQRPPSAGGGEIDPEKLEKLLSFLDPTDFRDHDRWLHLMMACHHATDGAGMDEFLDWSQGDPQYANDRGLNARRWDSLHGQQGGSARTIGTLLRELHEIKDPKLKEEALKEIPRDTAAEDFPDFKPEDENGRRPELSALQQLNQTHWAVPVGGKFRVMSRLEEPVGDGGDSVRKVWVTQTASDFMLLHGNKKAEVGDTVKPLGGAWLEWPQRRTVEGVLFDPSRNWPGWLNLWQGLAVEPKPGDWSYMQELIRDVLCQGDDALEKYVLDWLAHCVQKPAQRAEVALVFRGDKGTGKSTLGRAMRDIFGVHGLHISSPSHLTGRFNSHLRDCVLLFADEAFWAGDKASESVLKQLVTEATMMYEAKGVDARSEQNHIHIIIASNERWVVPAGINGERRFCVMDVSNKYQRDDSFFNPLNRQLERGGLQAMLFDLLSRDLGDRHPRDNVPVTGAMSEQKVRSLEPVPAWWLERLHEGTIPQIAGTPWAEGDVRVLAQDMQTSAEAHLREIGMRGSRRSVGTQLGQELGLLIPNLRKVRAAVPEGRMDVASQHDGRAYTYLVPSLNECRRHFAERLLQDPNYQWSTPVQDAEDDDWLN